MSIKIMNAVWSDRNEWLKGSRRLVLLALADNSNDDGYCWPSIKTISRRANLYPRYVIKILSDLEEQGYIQRQQRTKDGVKISTVYVLSIDKLQGGSVSEDTRGSVSEDTRVVSQRTHKPSVNHQIEPPLTREETFSLSGKENTEQTTEEIIAEIEAVSSKPLQSGGGDLNKTSQSDWDKRGAEALAQAMSSNGKYSVDVSDFPEDTRDVAGTFCDLWHIRPPNKKGYSRKGSSFGKWVEWSRDILYSCGELDCKDVLKRARQDYERYMDEHNGVAPFPVNDLGSIVRTISGTAGKMREERESGKRGKTVYLPGGAVTYPSENKGWNE